ncbi:MAG: hypothetical protein ACPGTS_00485 [Minisyncoccia bacterium]
MQLHNKNIIIAFDGPDNVGKGTQIGLLRKWLSHIPFVLTNLDRPHGATDDQKLAYGLAASRNHLQATQAIHNSNIPQIVDRMHYTEYAYSVLRGGHSIDTITALEQEYIDLKDNFFTLVFIDNVENIQARDDGLSVYDAENYSEVSEITNRFSDIAAHSLFDNAVINIHGKDIPSVQAEVENILLEKFPDLLNKE